MAKKGRDLFHVLQSRLAEAASGQRARTRTEPARRSRRAPAAGPGLLASAWGRAKAALSGAAVSPTERPARAGLRAQLPNSGFLVAPWLLGLLALGCLGVGFVLGRFTVPAVAAERALDARGGIAPQPVGEPPVPAERVPRQERSGPGWLPPEREAEKLSTVCWRLLTYSPSQKDIALQLAQYLREHGVPTARVLFTRDGWEVVCWVVDPVQPQQVLDQILALREPVFEPSFRDAVEQVRRQPRKFLCELTATKTD